MGALMMTLAAGLLAATGASQLPVKLEVRVKATSRLSNIHISSTEKIVDQLTVAYGPCDSWTLGEAYHTIVQVHPPLADTSRLVWVLPEDTESEGCLSAWNDRGLLRGRSEPQTWAHLNKRAAIPMANTSGIDVRGPWFEGVLLLKNKQPSLVDVATAKSKSVAIVGAGMSGLMTYLVLTQAGLTNISIVESTQRLGGRIRTEYLSGGPFDYSYQEMGPMRFPATYTDPVTNQTVNISDHQMVFTLADEMNKLNARNKNLSVDFIPWIQWNQNGLVYRNGFKLDTGFPPTVAQIESNSSLSPPAILDADTQNLQAAVESLLPNASFAFEMAKNMFKAHREWLANGLNGLGGDVWSESAFMINYLKGSLNSTDMLVGYRVADSFWEYLTSKMYFSASSFRTIDGGLNRLPLSFEPHVKSVTTFGRKIERVTFDSAANKIQLHWRDNFTSKNFHSSSHDYAIISAPFTVVRRWRLPPLPTTLSNAIQSLAYMTGCKVALEFRSRFWEHYSAPIYGGCSTTTDIWGIGEICYPSYNLNGTGPASILASWAPLDWGERWVSVSEAEHVSYVLDAMVEIHGEVARELYTGKYNRKCWLLEETGGWASPTVGQHQLYMPEYFKTHSNMIFVGEHTSFTHAWIASALESGIRGGVQLLLELGLIDEAKAAVSKWMARWIEI